MINVLSVLESYGRDEPYVYVILLFTHWEYMLPYPLRQLRDRASPERSDYTTCLTENPSLTICTDDVSELGLSRNRWLVFHIGYRSKRNELPSSGRSILGNDDRVLCRSKDHVRNVDTDPNSPPISQPHLVRA